MDEPTRPSELILVQSWTRHPSQDQPHPDWAECEFDRMLEHITWLENSLVELRVYRSGFFEKDKESAVLRQKLRQLTSANKLFEVCLTVGGILIGLTTFLFDKHHRLLGFVLFLIGFILIISSLRLKRRQMSE